MSRRGSCYDNAGVESFFASIKKESTRRHRYRDRDEAKADIFDYIVPLFLHSPQFLLPPGDLRREVRFLLVRRF
jgi:transposase InsO family protein